MRIHYAIAFLATVTAVDGWARDCTKTEAKAAEAKAAYLKSWPQVYEAYKRYKHCDDGAIAEGFTESVTVLLAKQWQQLPELVARTNNDTEFREFVMRHIDASADESNLKAIEKNAKTRCPDSQKSLCAAIAERARSQ